MFLTCPVVSRGGHAAVRQSSPSQRSPADRQTDIKQAPTNTKTYEVGGMHKMSKKTTKAVWRQHPPDAAEKSHFQRKACVPRCSIRH